MGAHLALACRGVIPAACPGKTYTAWETTGQLTTLFLVHHLVRSGTTTIRRPQGPVLYQRGLPTDLASEEHLAVAAPMPAIQVRRGLMALGCLVVPVANAATACAPTAVAQVACSAAVLVANIVAAAQTVAGSADHTVDDWGLLQFAT